MIPHDLQCWAISGYFTKSWSRRRSSEEAFQNMDTARIATFRSVHFGGDEPESRPALVSVGVLIPLEVLEYLPRTWITVSGRAALRDDPLECHSTTPMERQFRNSKRFSRISIETKFRYSWKWHYPSKRRSGHRNKQSCKSCSVMLPRG